MTHKRHLLESNTFRAQDIHIHQDLLSIMPSALSRKREQKPGTELQKEKEDEAGYSGCILCHENVKLKKNPTGNRHTVAIDGKVATFINDFPYLPHEHRLYFLWSHDENTKKHACHKYKIEDFGKPELYWLLKACRDDALNFQSPSERADRVRLIAGFNIGSIAGQSVSHFHLQSGWEVVLNPRQFVSEELSLYFHELRAEDLIIFEDERYRIVAPWTPAGKYAIDLYFRDKYVISDLDDYDLKAFSLLGDAFIRIYHKYLGITNVNIVLRGSVKECRTEPLQFQFVPRANIGAMYEMLGVNVVDTFPQSIAAEFRRSHVNTARAVLPSWSELLGSVEDFDPEKEFLARVPNHKSENDG